MPTHRSLKLMLGAAVAAGVLVGTTTMSASAEATTQRPAVNGAYEIVNRDAYTKCLDFGSNAPGTVVGLAACYGGGSQLWWYNHGTPFPDDHMVSDWNGLCMDLRSNTVGAPIVLSVCEP